MKTLAEFTKTTLIGGLLIILPIYIAVLLLAKTVKGLLGLLQPVAERVPASVEFRQIVAIVLLVGVCFVVGLIVRTGPGLRAKNACERAVLERLPGYTFLRGLAKRLAGQSEEQTLQPALVEIEDALVPALIVEELEDGSYTVLVPSAPTPMAGSVYILPRDRVHPVDIPFTQAIGVFSKWGTGAGEFVRAMRDQAAVQQSANPAPQLKKLKTPPIYRDLGHSHQNRGSSGNRCSPRWTCTRPSSAQRCSFGNTLPGLRIWAGSKAHLTRCCWFRSSSLNMVSIRSRFSTPTPCSPVSTPPTSTQSLQDVGAELLGGVAARPACWRRRGSAGAGCRRRRGRRWRRAGRAARDISCIRSST